MAEKCRGRATSRDGSPPIGLQTLIDRTKRAAFVDELVKLCVSDEEALDAAKALSQSPVERAKRYGQYGAVGGVGAPLIQTMGKAVKGFVDAKAHGQSRLGGALGAVKEVTKGELARNAATGGLGGMSLNAARDYLQLQQAKKTHQRFLKERGVV